MNEEMIGKCLLQVEHIRFNVWYSKDNSSFTVVYLQRSETFVSGNMTFQNGTIFIVGLFMAFSIVIMTRLLSIYHSVFKKCH